MAILTPKYAFAMHVLFVAGSLQLACGKTNDDSDNGPIVVATWVKNHQAAVDALRAQLDEAATLIKDLPAESHRAAEPAVAILPITPSWREGENMVILRGETVRGLPEFGRDEGKSLEGGETSISVNYTGYVDLASAFSMVDKGESLYIRTKREGVGLARRISMIRYAIIERELSYQPGAIDLVARTFNAGTYQGVAHIVDLQGPSLVGSVAFSAANTGSFESYEGSEAFMLRADLEHGAMRAFHAELGTLFPDIEMPAPPSKQEN